MAEDKNIQKFNDEKMEDVNGGALFISKDLKAANYFRGSEERISKGLYDSDTQADIMLMGDMTRSVSDTSKMEKIKSGGIQKA